jgi:hypothetical protein
MLLDCHHSKNKRKLQMFLFEHGASYHEAYHCSNWDEGYNFFSISCLSSANNMTKVFLSLLERHSNSEYRNLYNCTPYIYIYILIIYYGYDYYLSRNVHFNQKMLK